MATNYLKPINSPVGAPHPSNSYSYTGINFTLNPDDQQIIFVPVLAVSWHPSSIHLADPANTKVEVCISSTQKILNDWTNQTDSEASWIEINQDGENLVKVDYVVHAMRFTYSGETTGLVEILT